MALNKYIESFVLSDGAGFSMGKFPRPFSLSVKLPRMLLYESPTFKKYQSLTLELDRAQRLDFKAFHQVLAEYKGQLPELT